MAETAERQELSIKLIKACAFITKYSMEGYLSRGENIINSLPFVVFIAIKACVEHPEWAQALVNQLEPEDSKANEWAELLIEMIPIEVLDEHQV